MAGEQVPAHPAVVPQGESVMWSALGSLLAGPLVWGGVGFVLDRVFGTAPVLMLVGAMGGCLLAFWIVYLRFGRGDAGKPRS